MNRLKYSVIFVTSVSVACLLAPRIATRLICHWEEGGTPVPVPFSEWTIETWTQACSAVSWGPQEIRAINRTTGTTVKLAVLYDETDTEVTVDDEGPITIRMLSSGYITYLAHVFLGRNIRVTFDDAQAEADFLVRMRALDAASAELDSRRESPTYGTEDSGAAPNR